MKKVLVALVGAGLLATSASAALLTHVGNTLMNGNGEAFGISVVAGNAKYKTSTSMGETTGALGDGTLLDWRFETGVNGVDPWTGTVPVSSGGGTYFDSPVCNEVVYTPQNWMKVYTTADINVAGFTGADIQTGTIPMIASYAVPLVGNIDISSLSDGQFYCVVGSYSGTATVTLTMTGSGQTDIPDVRTQGGGKNQAFLMEWNFDNTGLLYDNIQYQVQSSSNGGRRRYGGVILDGTVVPEPATLSLLALFGVIGIVRRRLVG